MESFVPAVVSGAIAAAVGVISAWASYLFGKRTMRVHLPIEIAKIRETAEEARVTAAREYQLQAIKALREAMGVPKTNIIDSTHDLSDRLRKFLSKEQEWSWTWNEGYYRWSFAHLLARPLVWIEILRRSTVYLDRSLGEAIEEEFRFLHYCHALEDAFSNVNLFEGTGYDTKRASAHVFGGRLSEMTNLLIKREDSRLVCVEYGEFSKLCSSAGDQAQHPAPALDGLVADLGRDPPADSYRLARLLHVYCFACALLEKFHLPYRQFESLDTALERRRDLFEGELGQQLASNLMRVARGSVDMRTGNGEVEASATDA